LRPFVDQAVRGTATNQILGAAFAESLTYRELERQARILRRRVEFKDCPGCRKLFDEESCPTPGCDPPEGAAVRRVARANWLIRAEHEGGNYREVVRWVCGRCKSLYPIRHRLTTEVLGDPCPICCWTSPEGTAPPRLTVWARVFPAPRLTSPLTDPDQDADDPYDDLNGEAE
jgi:hypothetical protein